jgi:hypothetical protein
MNRRSRITLVLVALFSLVPALSGDNRLPQKEKDLDKTEKKVKELMQKKLEHSQKLLEGLALNDFDKIGKHAEELMLISKKVEWQVVKTPRYEVQSNKFRRALEDLEQNAKDKDLDAAALSYVEMTLACVKCHKHVRAVRTTRLDDE